MNHAVAHLPNNSFLDATSTVVAPNACYAAHPRYTDPLDDPEIVSLRVTRRDVA
jgi:hypothetical protein